MKTKKSNSIRLISLGFLLGVVVTIGANKAISSLPGYLDTSSWQSLQISQLRATGARLLVRNEAGVLMATLVPDNEKWRLISVGTTKERIVSDDDIQLKKLPDGRLEADIKEIQK